MPLSEFQETVLQRLAANRNPNSYVAGGAAINVDRSSPRYSNDLDFFHDAEESVTLSATADIKALEDTGFTVQRLLQQPTFQRAVASKGHDALKLEWALDSAFRFFPVEPHPVLGYTLHRLDLATNKVLALAGRFEVRDFIDTLYFHRNGVRLGLLAWASAGKDPGFTPRLILEQAARFNQLKEEAFRSVLGPHSLDYPRMKRDWLDAQEEAFKLVDQLPAVEVGCLYLSDNGTLVNPLTYEGSVIKRFGSIGGVVARVVGESLPIPGPEARKSVHDFLERYERHE
jgi:hypothetical protein